LKALNLFKQTIMTGGLLLISTAAIAMPSAMPDLPLAGLYSTGVNLMGESKNIGEAEQHYSVVAGPDKDKPLSITGRNFVLGNDADSSWITGLSTENSTTTYRTEFNLAGLDLSTVVLTLDIAVDNYLDDILVNGESTGLSISEALGTDAFRKFHTFEIGPNSDFFESGVNRLDFKTGNGIGPGAFRVNATASGNPVAVPEPGVIALLAFGLFGLAISRRLSA